MANFDNKNNFLVYDDYMTPKYAWEDIKKYIPNDKIIWEAFYGDGMSGTYLKELGFNTIHEPIDFFNNNNLQYDMIVTNPPFNKIKKILDQLLIIDKPFILILPSSKINTQYFRKWKDKNIQLIIPKKRIQFLRDGKHCQSNCAFDCFYYCYKINLKRDLLFL